jgi:hypothetical protein
MKLDTLYRLISSPAWAPGAALLPTAPSLLTSLHQALINDALIPCPDPPPEISAAANQNSAEPILETQNSKLTSPPSVSSKTFSRTWTSPWTTSPLTMTRPRKKRG